MFYFELLPSTNTHFVTSPRFCEQKPASNYNGDLASSILHDHLHPVSDLLLHLVLVKIGPDGRTLGVAPAPLQHVGAQLPHESCRPCGRTPTSASSAAALSSRTQFIPKNSCIMFYCKFLPSSNTHNETSPRFCG